MTSSAGAARSGVSVSHGNETNNGERRDRGANPPRNGEAAESSGARTGGRPAFAHARAAMSRGAREHANPAQHLHSRRGRRAGVSATRRALPVWITLVCWTTLMLMLTSTPGSRLPRTRWIKIPGADKIVHAGLYGVWGAIAFVAARRQFPATATRQRFAGVVVAASLYGLGDEIHQGTIPGRSMDPMDWAADMAGATAAATLLARRELAHTPPRRQLGNG